MNEVISHLRKNWILYGGALCFVALFYKVFAFALVPFPGDLLVSWFFPYSSGGWEGYDPWTTHKEFIAADTVRQLYPWRSLGMEMLTNGIPPLWNPYAFSGTPLLANLQSALMYPVNLLFVIFPDNLAWVLYILLQPVLAFTGMYLFTRSLNLSKHATFFAAVTFPLVGYFIIWFEHGVVGHSALWLPFVLYGILKYTKEHDTRYGLLAAGTLTLSILAGHAQSSVFVLLTMLAFYIYLSGVNVEKILQGSWIFLLGAGLAAVQILPTTELMFYSARTTDASRFVLQQFQMPPQHIITLFAPDFFGNPATLNFWGVDYGEFSLFVGVPVLFFAVVALIQARVPHKKFFVGLIGASLAVSLIPQLFQLFAFLNIPVLGTGIPARTMFLFQFSLVILAGYGIDTFLKKNISWKVILGIIGTCILVWSITFTDLQILSDMPQNAYQIARRNLIIPTGILAAISAVILITRKWKKWKKVAYLAVVALALFESGYLMYKYLPFARVEYMFPEHPFVTYLQENTKPSRVYGYNTARLDANLFVHWRVQSPEGYDPLYIKRYGQLTSSAEKGQFTTDLRRSDAVIESSLPNDDTLAKRRLLNMMSTQYVLDKDDGAPEDWQQNAEVFPEDRYELIHQEYKWKVYNNREAFPRATIFYNFEKEDSEKEIIQRLFDEKFDYENTVILEEDPLIPKSDLMRATGKVEEYTENNVKISVDHEQDGILYLADTYYPGWKAYLDGIQVPILRANYAFRGVVVPKGFHTVTFVYQPASFYLGAFITITSLLIFATIYAKSKK